MSHASPTWSTRRLWVVAAALAVATWVLYLEVRANGFLHFDDDRYITDNPMVRAGLGWAGATWAFTTFAVANYHPVAWLAHMLDVQLFGLDAASHHLVSAGLHALNAAVLFRALARLTGAPGRSAVVAALFAVHPVNVETVAWIAERKELLAALFGFLALLAYAVHAERPSRARMTAVILAAAASLLAKPTWVTIPCLLVLLDVWPLRRVPGSTHLPDGRSLPVRSWSSLLTEKIPFALLAAASSVVTVAAQRAGGAVVGTDVVPLPSRLANAAVGYATYLGKLVWPTHLAAYYPLPAEGHPAGLVALSLVLVAALVFVSSMTFRRSPAVGIGLAWFLGTLVPMIGIVQVGSQAMADRYLYLPSTGFLVAVVWGLERLARGRRRATAVARTAVAGALVALGIATSRQIPVWRDQVTLFSRAIEVTGPNPRARHVLSQALASEGRLDDALAHGLEAARLDPANPRVRNNLGYVLYRLGRVDEAIDSLARAVAIDPGYAEAHANLGIAYARRGQIDLAARHIALAGALRGTNR